MPARIPIDRAAVAAFCRRHHIRRLALFGSVLRDDFRPDDSDVDVLVEFEPDHLPSLFELSRMERQLAPLFGDRSVEMVAPTGLSRYIRPSVLAAAEALYEQG